MSREQRYTVRRLADQAGGDWWVIQDSNRAGAEVARCRSQATAEWLATLANAAAA